MVLSKIWIWNKEIKETRQKKDGGFILFGSPWRLTNYESNHFKAKLGHFRAVFSLFQAHFGQHGQLNILETSYYGDEPHLCDEISQGFELLVSNEENDLENRAPLLGLYSIFTLQ